MSEFSAKEAHQAGRLKVVLVVVAVFFVFEFAGAQLAASDVLQADALHLLMDVLALAMSLFAMRLAVRKPTPRYTFGLRRAEPVAAVANALLVIFASIEIVRDAIRDLAHPSPPRAGLMLIVAIAALFVNGLSAWLLHGAIGHDHGHHGHAHGHEDSKHAHDHGTCADEHDHAKHDHGHGHGGKGHALVLRGAWLHLLGDTLGSVAALVAAIVIKQGGPTAVDPIASLVVVAILLAGAFRLLRDAVKVLLDAAPDHLPVEAVREAVLAETGVAEIVYLHVWTLGAGHDAMTVHVRARAADVTLGSRVCADLKKKFGLEYVTVQVESASADT